MLLGSYMVVAAGVAANYEEARAKLAQALESGEAFATFKRFVAAQGGNPAVADDTALLPQAGKRIPVTLGRAGYVSRIHAEEVGTCAMLLGAGRERKE